jgi:uncharacterized protein (TIGR02996 family)
VTDADWDRLLDQTPGDATLRLGYADWLEENGETARAGAQRWLAARGLYPQPYGTEAEGKVWWYKREQEAYRHDPNDLPLTLCDSLQPPTKTENRRGMVYPSRRAAEDDLARALVELGEVPA